MLFTTGSPDNVASACYLVYNRVNATIGLYTNDASTLNTKVVGSASSLQNNQCAVGYAFATSTQTSVTFTVNLVFKTSFKGAKTVYLQANEPASNSGSVARGTWTVL